MASIRSSSLVPRMSMLLFITTLLFVNMNKLVNSTDTLSFSFSKFFSNQQDLVYQGDALVTLSGNLQLTKISRGEPVPNSIGRALYAAPVHIWDNETGSVASFSTSFSFVIDSLNPSKTADGLAFFLAPVDTKPQKPGGFLGLFPDVKTSKSNQVVAVEFDTFRNDWDPVNTHIGIDVNGIKSVKTTPWDLAYGRVANVVISYEASTELLTASLTYPSTQTGYFISTEVHLKKVLPEFVRVGFSATSGLSQDFVQSHDILSWSFRSNLPVAGTNGDGGAFNPAHVSTSGLDSI